MDRVPDGRLYVASIHSGRVVRCVGRANATVCERLRAYLDRQADNPPSELFLELSQAKAIDSTFVGFLLGLSTGRNKGGKFRLTLVNPSAVVQRALIGMHVLQCFQIRPGLPELPNEWRDIEGQPADAAAFADLVIAAHGHLIDADERNRESFGKVVETFQKARDAGKPESPNKEPE